MFLYLVEVVLKQLQNYTKDDLECLYANSDRQKIFVKTYLADYYKLRTEEELIQDVKTIVIEELSWR